MTLVHTQCTPTVHTCVFDFVFGSILRTIIFEGVVYIMFVAFQDLAVRMCDLIERG